MKIDVKQIKKIELGNDDILVFKGEFQDNFIRRLQHFIKEYNEVNKKQVSFICIKPNDEIYKVSKEQIKKEICE